MRGLPGLRGTDHVGFTVPDLEVATRFLVDVIGCETVYEVGPFRAEDDWMAVHLGVHPRAVIRKLRMLRCRNGSNFEIFEFEPDGTAAAPPRNSDVGGHHLGFWVDDIDAAVAHLRAHGVEVQGEVTTMTSGPSRGLRWVYFRAPWGMQLELVSAPEGIDVLRDAPGALWSPVAEAAPS